MAEELTEYYADHGVRVRYLHCDIETIERTEIIRELREGSFDVLVGINLLREGLDIPEVSLVAILDADKEGFLRSTRSLIQTIGRAARNVERLGDPLRGPGDRLDPRHAGRDESTPGDPGGVQPGARHHPRDGGEAHLEPARLDLGGGLRDGSEAGRSGRSPRSRPRAPGASRGPADARWPRRLGNSSSSARRSCAIAFGRSSRSACGPPERGSRANASTPSPRARRLSLQERRGARCSTWARPRTCAAGSGPTCSRGATAGVQIPRLVERIADVEGARHPHREGCAAARERADQAAQAHLQRQAPGRQAVPGPAPRPGGGVAAAAQGAALQAGRSPVLRSLHLQRRDAGGGLEPAPDLPAALLQRCGAQGLRAAWAALHRVRDEALFRSLLRAGERGGLRGAGPGHRAVPARPIRAPGDDASEKMEAAAEEERFEDAARLRDRIGAVERTVERQQIVGDRRVDRDVFGLARDGGEVELQVLHVRDGRVMGAADYGFSERAARRRRRHGLLSRSVLRGRRRTPGSRGDPAALRRSTTAGPWRRCWASARGRRVAVRTPKRGSRRELVSMAARNAELGLARRLEARESIDAALEELRERLGLSTLPRRIECYDVSNLQGALAVASRVVFESGQPQKTDYRRYKIREARGGDDLACMREALERRLARIEREPLPDLLIVDGGKGQLGVVTALLRDRGLAGGSPGHREAARRGEPLAASPPLGGTEGGAALPPGPKRCGAAGGRAHEAFCCSSGCATNPIASPSSTSAACGGRWVCSRSSRSSPESGPASGARCCGGWGRCER